MNLLKSIFISHYMMLLMAIAGYAGWMLYLGENPIAWSGVMLTAGPIMIVISRIMLFKNVARTSARFPLVNFLGAVGTGLAAWAGYGQGASAAAPALAITGWIGFLLYAYWFSTYGGRQPSAELQVGSTLPGFTVRNASGMIVTSAQLTDKPAILIFYRGNWCPLCMAQIKELVSRYKDISALGVRVALISPQPHSNTEALAKKFGVKFDFLTDEENAAALALGIAQDHGLPMGMQMMGYGSETVLPTVIITGKNGEVIWTHETDNYRIRPEPDVYLDVLRQHRIVSDAVW
ncbi:MAG: AhpC/TSA family protein [Methylobacter sp.]|uniref:peroxiredoxin-like family protein n=1 Tax=Methylobacter sp. TaxID=2051955 RepID=UPI002582C406|nr:peroxiredoxin-like family protein [Methylobacter sp.]MCL7419731.1 AhpC/TSA family protein [Methylobacter sp.]